MTVSKIETDPERGEEKKAKKTKDLQKSMERYVKEKGGKSTSVKSSPSVSSPKPPPAPIKDDPTDRQNRKLSKIMKRINITYDDPKKYKGPHVEGWPPTKDRYMPNYIKPDQDTFPLRPSKAHFQGK